MGRQNPSDPRILRAILFVALCSGVWFSDWLVISGEGVYTEGLEREPTIVVEYRIDSEKETISISFENATPLLNYWIERVDVGADDEGGSDNSDGTESVSESEVVQLQSIRFILGMLLLLFLLSSSESIRTESILWLRFGGAIWIFIGLVLIIGVPLAAASDLGFFADKSSTGGFDTSAEGEVEASQFAHYESSSDTDLSLAGLNFEFDSVGYDLGLLAKEDRQAVIDNAPKAGEAGYESLIRFHGELSSGFGAAFFWWLLAAFCQILFYKSAKRNESEGSESASSGV